MFWALASSFLVIYLYRKLNAESAPATVPATDAGAAGTVESELAAMGERIAALESKIGKARAGSVTP